ncbi:MAG: hypothetical protein EAZ97_07380 [Bacteroidetes bacterium]|nr:MAG: hypothetical protein EAZ97_07380 [Bacteroidota bacterium]
MLLPESIDKSFRYNTPQELINLKEAHQDLIKSVSIENSTIQMVFQEKEKSVETELQFNHSAIVKTQCNCRGYGECVHQKVAKLYLKEHFIDKILPTLTVRNSADPFAINVNINEEELNALLHAPIEYSWRGTQIESVEENNLVLKINGHQTQKVEFQISENQAITKCSCQENFVDLCPHQHAVLIANIRNGENLLKIASANGLKELRKNTLVQYGLPENTNFDDFFEITSDKLKIFYKPHKSGSGLQPIKAFRTNLHFEKFESAPNPISSSADKEFILSYFFSYEQGRRVNYALDSYKGKMSKTTMPKSLKRAHPTDLVYCIADDIDHELMNRMSKYGNYFELMNEKTSWFFSSVIRLLRVYSDIFPLLATRNRVFLAENENNLSKAVPVQVSVDPVKLHFEFSEDEHYLNLRKIMTINGEIIKKYEKIDALLIRIDDTLHTFASPQDVQADYKMDGEEVLRVVKKDFNDFFTDYILPISKEFKIDYALKSREVKNIGLIADKKCIYLTEDKNTIQFKPTVLYNNGEEINALSENDICKKKGNNLLVYTVDKDFHQEYASFLRSLHPNFANQNHKDFLMLNFSDFDVSWFADFYEKMNQESIEIYGFNELKHFKYSPHKPTLRTTIASKQDWFEVDVEIKFGNETISLKDLQKSIANRNRYVRLGDGSMGLLPEEWLEKLANYSKHGEVSKGKLQISKFKFSILDDLFDNIDDKTIIKELAEKKKKLAEFSNIEKTKIPSQIKATLRDYQKEGYNWLNFLDNYKWGGILADDMGLGKTLQIITFLQQQASSNKLPNLIVVPTSLIFNWKNELEKFAPKLKIHFHYGNSRTSETEIFKDFNLIITTYGTMLNDIEVLQQARFNYVILDESQSIKNPSSKRYKAACLLKSTNRIAMTGTPIENNTFDLYAQMNFLNPGFLGNQETFKRNYATPIDKDRNKKVAIELQKMIKPFILRRMKEQVATELPPKVEDYLYCEMEAEQTKVYEAFRQKYRDYLVKKFDADGFAKSKLYVLEGLTKLRQICDSPSLLSDDQTYTSESVKIKELMRHIKEKTSNHKMLLFSQFVKMLRLVETELKNNGISYEYLDGQCTQEQRENSVNHFQNDESCRVFLISLKAGGSGLNLTKADYVYIIDPWWNPAVENQAIDRCYRIGQEKHIIAYRMICKDTVEEKIVNIQNRKKQVSNELIVTDENVVKQLSQEDILDLFS